MLFRSASLPALPHKVNDPESKRYIMASYHQKAIILPWWSRNLTYTVLEALKMVFPEFKANKKSYNMEFILIGFISYFLCINLRDRRKGSYRLHSSTKAGKKKKTFFMENTKQYLWSFSISHFCRRRLPPKKPSWIPALLSEHFASTASKKLSSSHWRRSEAFPRQQQQRTLGYRYLENCKTFIFVIQTSNMRLTISLI